ncbi:MAG: site-2 protease family protein [Nanoarchaeota archaeon]|nr:site-2 protease family protein [Nanoarchaeota archaeon]
MNWDLLFALIFYGIIVIWFLRQRSRWEVQGKIIGIYRTKIGLKLMEIIAKKVPWLLRLCSGLSVVIGFLGMGAMFYYLLIGTYNLIAVPKSLPAVAPVLPGVKIPGLPDLSFWHWIVSIFIVAAIHEFAHGVYARLYKIPVKSSGIALFGPILGAFVEPDEKIMQKQSKWRQMTVFSAGPFSNVILAIVALLLLTFVSAPIYGSLFEGTGIQVNTVLPDHAAALAGMQAPVIVTAVNGFPTTDVASFAEATKDIKPSQVLKLETDHGVYTVVTEENPGNSSRGFIGISDFEVRTEVKPEMKERFGVFIPKVITWLHMLLFWLFIVSLGIGLFNLLPLGPIDGGRMFLVAMQGLIKNQSYAKRIFMMVTLFCLLLIFINLFPYLWKLLVWIISPFTG